MSKISITTLGDLVEFQRGYDLPKSEFKEGNVPVISSNGILGFHNVAKVKAPGITIGRSGTVGLPHYINEDFFPHNTSLFIKDFKGNIPQYIFYLIKTLKLNEYGSGSGVPTMNRNHLHPIKVSAHLDKVSQQKIAKVLSDLDAKIELNNKINVELEAMAKTLYDYWFVQFDFPVSASCHSELVSESYKGYKTSGGKMVWNAELKRDVPEGWEVVKMKKLANTGSGGTPLSTKKEFYENGNIPWINSGEVNEPFIVKANKFITKDGLNNSSAKLFERGTILMAMYGATAGKVSLIDIEASTNQAICGIMPFDEIYKFYIKFGLEDLYKYLISLSTGSARDNLSQDKIKELDFINPNQTILKKFDVIVSPMMNKILMNLKENQELASLRDWLLPMLMNGQVSVASKSSTEKSYEIEDSELGMVAERGVEYKK
jgi:type I restriction enzyme S subunit